MEWYAVLRTLRFLFIVFGRESQMSESHKGSLIGIRTFKRSAAGIGLGFLRKSPHFQRAAPGVRNERSYSALLPAIRTTFPALDQTHEAYDSHSRMAVQSRSHGHRLHPALLRPPSRRNILLAFIRRRDWPPLNPIILRPSDQCTQRPT